MFWEEILLSFYRISTIRVKVWKTDVIHSAFSTLYRSASATGYYYTNCILFVWFSSKISGVRGLLFRGGKVTFPDFSRLEICIYPVIIAHFGTPQTNFSGFQKVTSKKIIKQGSSASFLYLFPSLFDFHVFLFKVSFFSSPFSLSSWPLFSPVGQQKTKNKKQKTNKQTNKQKC